MSSRTLVLALTVVFLASSPVLANSDAPNALPEIDGEAVVARVNGEPIFLDDLVWSLANMHSEMGDSTTPTEVRTPDQSLQRLVDIELVVQEARTIGLDELPDFRRAQEAQERRFLLEALLQREVPAVPPPTDAEVDHAYRTMRLQVRMNGLMLESEKDALAFRSKVVGGGDFVELARARPDFFDHQLIPSEGWMRLTELYPTVAEVLADSEPDQLTDPIEVPGEGWAVIEVLETELPEDPAEREASRSRVAANKRADARRAYIVAIREQYATVDQDAVEAIDFQAEDVPFEAFLEDRTPLVRFENAAPITVADLAEALQAKFFHGAIKAAERGDLRAKKRLVLDDLAARSALRLEALRLGIDRSVDFRSQMRYFESVSLFGMFVDRVVTRDLRAYREDLERTYEKHKDRLANPARVQLTQLVFTSRDAAEQALSRLRSGADFDWVRTNTPGLVTGDDVHDYWEFSVRTVNEEALPKPVREALEGAQAGDYRLVSEGDSAFHVLQIVDRTPAYVPSFEEIGSKLGPLALGEMRDQALKEYIALLRESSEIELLAEGERLRDVVMDSLGRGETD